MPRWADTFGTLVEIAQSLGVAGRQISSGVEKREFVWELDPTSCAAIGNGRNDAEMLAEVALGIAVLGPEGLSRAALTMQDGGKSEEAVAICGNCSVGLCLLHLRETGEAVNGMTWLTCPHDAMARSKRPATARP